MALEKEVLELYKMLEYWKGEAKGIQETHAVENKKLRNTLHLTRLCSVIKDVFSRQTAASFQLFKNATKTPINSDKEKDDLKLDDAQGGDED